MGTMTMTENTTENTEIEKTETPEPTVGLSIRQLDALHADLHPGRVSHRDQGGASLAYLEAWDIKAMLIRAFGYGGFSADVIESDLIKIITDATDRQGNPKTPQALAKSTVRITIYGIGPGGQDVTYTESAIGSNSGWDLGDIADNAIKSASSDALKRAAIYLGSQFGLSLYRKGQTADVVRVVFAPHQADIITDLVKSRQDDPQVSSAARQRLQKRLKVHANPAAERARAADASNPYAEQDGEARPEPAPERDPAADGAEPPLPPAQPAKASGGRKASPARQSAARRALENAEKAAGVTPKK